MAELSIGLQLTWQIAAGEAAEARHECIEPEHLFIGLCSLEKTLQAVELGQLVAPKEVIMALRPEWKVLAELFAKFHLKPTALRRELRKRMGLGNYQGHDKVIRRSPQSRQVFERAQQLAQEAPASMVDVIYLLAALLEVQGGLIAALLREGHADIEGLKGEALAITLPPFEGQPEGMALDPFRGEACQSFLQQYGKDLTQLAREGKLHAPIGRRAEMLQVVRTLARETKNNPVLVGDAGVGKTAIVEGLAWRIAQGKSTRSAG